MNHALTALAHQFPITTLGAKGALYSTFTEEKGFAALLRMHLSRQVQDWNKTWGLNHLVSNQAAHIADPTISTLEVLGDDDDDDEGFLDLVEQGAAGANALFDVMINMVRSLEELGNQVHLRTTELNQVDVANDVKGAKRVIDRVALDMEQYVVRSEVEIPLFKEAFNLVIGSFSKAVALLSDFGEQSAVTISSSMQVIIDLEDGISTSEDQLVGFRQIIASLPRMSTRLKKAKRRTLEVLDQLTAEIRNAKNMTCELRITLTDLTDTI